MDELCCPITLTEFVKPIVLDCGHTFDESSLQALNRRKCPICQAPTETINRVNWTVLTLIEARKVKEEAENSSSKANGKSSKPKPKRMNAREANELFLNSVRTQANEFIETKVMEALIKSIEERKREFTVHVNDSILRNEVANILTGDKYNVKLIIGGLVISF